MILDSSAVVAVVFQEPGYEKLLDKILGTDGVAIGAPTLAETGIVVSARLGVDARPLLSRFLREGAIETLPFGEAQFGVAVGAWLQFGRGRHRVGLNLGDCLAYATARLAGRPLLCVGGDFSETDLALA
jgi:ribonuclease VapC